LTTWGCNNIVISWLHRTCWNNLATSTIISTWLLQVVNFLFQKCWQLGTSSANTTCWRLVGRLAIQDMRLLRVYIAQLSVYFILEGKSHDRNRKQTYPKEKYSNISHIDINIIFIQPCQRYPWLFTRKLDQGIRKVTCAVVCPSWMDKHNWIFLMSAWNQLIGTEGIGTRQIICNIRRQNIYS
jgi:hypothetical protein